MIDYKWLIAVISFCVGLGVVKVANERDMTHEYNRQANALERIAAVLEGSNGRH